MAATLGDLIAECESFLYSYFNDRDKVTSTTGAITSSDLTIPVAEGGLVDRGFVEIDYELIAVKSRNDSTLQLTVHPWGRGQRGTTAAAHSSGAKVTINPRFPRSWIKTEINTSISNLFPDLFAVATDRSNTVNPAVTTYPLPAAAEGVLKVDVQLPGPSGLWQPLNRHRFDYSADTTTYSTGRTIDILEQMPPGRVIQVVYRKGFGSLSLDSDTLASAGVDDSWRDLIKLDTCSRMVLALDSSRLAINAVEASNRAQVVTSGSATAVARQLMQNYQIRLANEKQLLQQRYPITAVIRT